MTREKAEKKGRPYGCGLGPAFEVIGGRWKALLLYEIHVETRRFGELKRLVEGISEKVLIQQLREMEADGLIHRKVLHEVPPRVEYSITGLGASLDDALIPLAKWGEQHAERIVASRT